MEKNKCSILHRLKVITKLRMNEEAFVFVSPGGGRLVVTWNDLYVNSCRVATGFTKMGLKPKEYVFINTRNCPEGLYAIYGSMMAGAIPFCRDVYFTDGADFKDALIQLNTCSMLIVDPAHNKDVWTSMKQHIGSFSDDGSITNSLLPHVRYIVCNEVGRNDDTRSLCSIQQIILSNMNDVDLPIQSEEVSVVLRTSGSTGKPKLVRRSSYENFTDALITTKKTLKMYCDNSFMMTSGFPMSSVLKGVTRVMLMEPCDKQDYVKLRSNIIKQERCVILECLCHELDELVNSKEDFMQEWPVKQILIGGRPVSYDATEVLGLATKFLTLHYGITETGGISFYNVTEPNKFQSYCVGYLINGVEVRIVDDSMNRLATNSRGEILVKTPTMFNEYVNDKDATESAFKMDGWYCTGDIGMVTDDKKLFVFGRKWNKITKNYGDQYDPYVIESTLMSIKNVKEAVVIPVVQDIGYQNICACIIPSSGNGLSEESIRRKYENLLVANVSHQVSRICLIDYFMFYTSFPIKSNKIDRVKLTETAREQFGKSGN